MSAALQVRLPDALPAAAQDNESQAHTFLSAVMADYWPDPDYRLETRTFEPAAPGEKDRPGAREWYPLTTDGLAAAARDAVRWSQRLNVYFGVLPRLGRGGKASDCPDLMWLWADLDPGDEGPEAVSALLRNSAGSGLPAPHLIVCSGGGLHCYWRLADSLDLDDFGRESAKQLLQRLARAIGGEPPAAHADKAAAEVARVLRVPGTWSHKRQKPVRLLRCRPETERYPWTWWSALLPVIPAPAPPAREYHQPGSSNTGALRWAEEWASVPAAHGERHQELLARATWMCREAGLDQSTVLRLLERKAAISDGPPMPESELLQICRWAGGKA